MRSMWREMLFALVMGLVVPALLLSMAVLLLDREPETNISAETVEAETLPIKETVLETVPLTMRLRDTDGSVTEMDMDAYLVGVVLAEMPASFELEALKAQAVVARTYTQKAVTTGGKHGDGSVCTQYSCCQAYITESGYLAKGGTQESIDKVSSAVRATSGCVLTYDGELIEATYFSCSGGITEDAAAVWGTDYPYLRSVKSPGEEEAAYYTDTVEFTAQAFQDALGVSLSGEPESWFGSVTYTAGDGVDTMDIGGVSYSGTKLRSLLGLRSTSFTVSVSGESITITTRGFGHRVGMSQYGADAMAVAGSGFAEILAYYYQGTELIQWELQGK